MYLVIKRLKNIVESLTKKDKLYILWLSKYFGKGMEYVNDHKDYRNWTLCSGTYYNQ